MPEAQWEQELARPEGECAPGAAAIGAQSATAAPAAAAPATTATLNATASTAASAGLSALAAAALAACGGGGSADEPTAPSGPPPSAVDASRFLTQASFGLRSVDDVAALQAQGFEAWLNRQFSLQAASHVSYLDGWAARRGRNRPVEEASYEAIWQQWLTGEDQLRGRVSWALLQIFVISNIAPDIRPYAMSSYMDTLNRHAFGNYRQLLEAVALHPAMGYYLNMLGSEKEIPGAGTHPNENFAREVLQLFSIGLVRLNPDGSAILVNGQPAPTYDQAVVRGYAAAFTGWSYGAEDNTDPRRFHNHNDNDDANWVTPMKAWPSYHDTGAKTLLDGRVLPAGQTPEKDMADALDSIAAHANVGPFIGRQLIQRLVTSNPSPAYIARVAAVFADNGQGVRGDLKAVVRAILLDVEARGDAPASQPNFGKQREPVIRFANFLRGLGAQNTSGENDIHYLDSADNGLGQSPLLAPSVFNFYSPNFRPAGPLAAAGLVAPEFQITSETTVVGSMNFFASLFDRGGFGDGAQRLPLNYEPLIALAATPDALVERLNQLFFNRAMSASTRKRLLTLLNGLAGWRPRDRVIALLKLVAMAPDFVIQR